MKWRRSAVVAAEQNAAVSTGAPFLCIEPWRGYASPKDFDGEFSDKPGLMHIAAGAEEELSYRIEIGSS